MEKDIQNEGDQQVVYELGYLFVPTLTEEKVSVEVKDLHASIEKQGASIISSENPIYIDLAYTIAKVTGTERNKYDKGYFGWVKFETNPDSIALMKKDFDLSSIMLRYLITKTVKENTLLNGKMMFHVEEQEADLKEVIEDVVEVGEVVIPDLDKSIDELVTI